MREVLYVSERKLDWEFSHASRRDRWRAGAEGSLGLPGSNLKLSVPAPTATGAPRSVEIAVKLEQVIRYLQRTHQPPPFSTPASQPVLSR
jgi:hypothetical protein